jgi:hypothetical protein
VRTRREPGSVAVGQPVGGAAHPNKRGQAIHRKKGFSAPKHQTTSKTMLSIISRTFGESTPIKMQLHIPLTSAYLCQDCNCIGNCSRQCPACASAALMNLAGVLDRSEVRAPRARVLEIPVPAATKMSEMPVSRQIPVRRHPTLLSMTLPTRQRSMEKGLVRRRLSKPMTRQHSEPRGVKLRFAKTPAVAEMTRS